MIEGVVNAAREAVVILPVQGPAGLVREIEVVIDTGYSGFLTLPPSLVEELGLPFHFRGRAFLANGSEETFDVFGVTTLWDGRPRFIEADGACGHVPARQAQLEHRRRRRRPRSHTVDRVSNTSPERRLGPFRIERTSRGSEAGRPTPGTATTRDRIPPCLAAQHPTPCA